LAARWVVGGEKSIYCGLFPLAGGIIQLKSKKIQTNTTKPITQIKTKKKKRGSRKKGSVPSI
jgi:hypothetical protein